MRVVVQEAEFDPGAELNAFGRGNTDIGAIVSFTGVTRDVSGGLSEMQIEHYPGMTERAITQICEEAQKRWSLADVLVIHRHGLMQAGDNIMMVATASRHRTDAFAAADFLMDYLKSRAPFWKKEVTAQGADWVESKQDDEDALDRWS
ncbi:molybdopterin synthase subunit MoaE [Litoreibacter ponti]|uniref:Molybdopterin synthase catalytic subunit n=1 Tax=Litoreibacter ponti TaxID=1510457 RepID=A0A2T6BFU8_9RHOB|nr:molybdenum cofactor biosynthesis protein MoaE [Litoreibacter ponti]PTX54929.1 molybdopterin synthase subunit MoaE [Litoreibacter ponti]